MELETFHKADYIVDAIKHTKNQINIWSKHKIGDVVNDAVIQLVDCNSNFEIFREGIVFKLKEHKQMLEEELAKL